MSEATHINYTDYDKVIKERLGQKPPAVALARAVATLAERQRSHRSDAHIEGLTPQEEAQLAVDAVVLCERLSDAVIVLLDVQRQIEGSQHELLDSALTMLNG